MLYSGKKLLTKYQKIPDGKGGFEFIESESGKYTKEDFETIQLKREVLQQNQLSEKSRKQQVKRSHRNSNLIVLTIVVLFFGSCWYAFNDISNLPTTDIDPAKVLYPQERKEICYELYNTPEERGALIACVARVNSDY